MITNFENRCVLKFYVIVLIPIFDTTYKGKYRSIFSWDIYITNWSYSKKVGICFAMYQRMIPKRTSWYGTRLVINLHLVRSGVSLKQFLCLYCFVSWKSSLKVHLVQITVVIQDDCCCAVTLLGGFALELGYKSRSARLHMINWYSLY